MTTTTITTITTTVFVLYCAIAYCNSASHLRSSAPLNEIALQQLHMHHCPFQVQLQIAINFSWLLNISIITRPHQDQLPPPRRCQMGMSMLRQLWFILILFQPRKGYLVGQYQLVTALGQHQLLTIFVTHLCHPTAQAAAPQFTPNLTSTMLRRGLREIPPMLLQEASNVGL